MKPGSRREGSPFDAVANDQDPDHWSESYHRNPNRQSPRNEKQEDESFPHFITMNVIH